MQTMEAAEKLNTAVQTDKKLAPNGEETPRVRSEQDKALCALTYAAMLGEKKTRPIDVDKVEQCYNIIKGYHDGTSPEVAAAASLESTQSTSIASSSQSWAPGMSLTTTESSWGPSQTESAAFAFQVSCCSVSPLLQACHLCLAVCLTTAALLFAAFLCCAPGLPCANVLLLWLQALYQACLSNAAV